MSDGVVQDHLWAAGYSLLDTVRDLHE